MKLPDNINKLLNTGTAKGEWLEYKAGWNPEVTPQVIELLEVLEGEMTEERGTGIPKIFLKLLE